MRFQCLGPSLHQICQPRMCINNIMYFGSGIWLGFRAICWASLFASSNVSWPVVVNGSGHGEVRILFGQWKRCGGRRLLEWKHSCETINLFGNDWFRTKNIFTTLTLLPNWILKPTRQTCSSGMLWWGKIALVVVQRHKQNHLIIFKNVVSITKTVEHRFQNHSKQVTGGILPENNNETAPTNANAKQQKSGFVGSPICGFLEKKCYNGNCKRKNTDASACFTFSSSCPFLTWWRLEEYRRNDTYDCENYDCHVQPEQQRCAHPLNKTTTKHDRFSGSETAVIKLRLGEAVIEINRLKRSLKHSVSVVLFVNDVMETSRGKCLVTTTISFLRFVTNSVYVINDIANENTAYDITFTKLSWLSPRAVNLDTMPPRGK